VGGDVDLISGDYRCRQVAAQGLDFHSRGAVFDEVHQLLDGAFHAGLFGVRRKLADQGFGLGGELALFRIFTGVDDIAVDHYLGIIHRQVIEGVEQGLGGVAGVGGGARRDGPQGQRTEDG